MQMQTSRAGSTQQTVANLALGSARGCQRALRCPSLLTVHRPRTTDHCGFTLVELLVVIAIISMVTIATVPMILPALDTRRIREASRVVSTHFASAQSEALAKGRPVGVWIERLPGEKTAAMDLFLCEVPPPYAGDTVSSQVTVKISGASPNVAGVKFGAGDATALQAGFLKPGDLIRFGYRGPYFRFASDSETLVPTATNVIQQVQNVDCLNPSNNNRMTPCEGYAILPLSTADYITNPTPTKPVYRALPVAATQPGGWTTSYQIFRTPVKSVASPVQLPGGAVLDLYTSGMTTNGIFGDSASSLDKPILVMFDKTGALESLYWDGDRLAITGPLYFLIGKRSKLPHVTYSKNDPVETQAEKHNFRDLENIWVSINPQTGLVTTAENSSVNDNGLSATTEAALLTEALPISRAFATSAQSMGGR
jgi:prepilin-type N-terminal cleavage/methylation domain-containing protein